MPVPSDPDAVTVSAVPGANRTGLRRTWLLLVLLVGVGAIVFGARWDGELGGEGRTPSTGIVEEQVVEERGVGDAIVSAISVVVLTIVLVFLVRRAEPTILLLVLGVVALLVLFVLMLRIAEPPPVEEGELVVDEVAETVDDDASSGSLGIGLAVGALAALSGLVLIRRRRRRRVDEPVTDLVEELVEVAAEVRRAGADDRSAIIDAYRRVEGTLELAGHGRRPHETTAEHLSRVLRLLAAGEERTAAAVDELASIYQDVAFGFGDPAIAERVGSQRARVAVLFDEVAAGLERANEATPAAPEGAAP